MTQIEPLQTIYQYRYLILLNRSSLLFTSRFQTVGSPPRQEVTYVGLPTTATAAPPVGQEDVRI